MKIRPKLLQWFEVICVNPAFKQGVAAVCAWCLKNMLQSPHMVQTDKYWLPYFTVL